MLYIFVKIMQKLRLLLSKIHFLKVQAATARKRDKTSGIGLVRNTPFSGNLAQHQLCHLDPQLTIMAG